LVEGLGFFDEFLDGKRLGRPALPRGERAQQALGYGLLPTPAATPQEAN